MSRITVQPAGADRRVPVEKLKGVYFEQGTPREVHHTRYIKRRLNAGDLVKVEATAATPAAATATTDQVEARPATPAAASTPTKGD